MNALVSWWAPALRATPSQIWIYISAGALVGAVLWECSSWEMHYGRFWRGSSVGISGIHDWKMHCSWPYAYGYLEQNVFYSVGAKLSISNKCPIYFISLRNYQFLSIPAYKIGKFNFCPVYSLLRQCNGSNFNRDFLEVTSRGERGYIAGFYFGRYRFSLCGPIIFDVRIKVRHPKVASDH